MRCRKTAAAVVSVLLGFLCWGQTDLDPEGKIDPAGIQSLKARAQESRTLSPALEERIASLAGEALEALRAASASRVQIRRYQREQAQIQARRREELRTDFVDVLEKAVRGRRLAGTGPAAGAAAEQLRSAPRAASE